MSWEDTLKEEEKTAESNVDKEEFINLIKNPNSYLEVYYIYKGKKLDSDITYAINWLAYSVSESDLSVFYERHNDEDWVFMKSGDEK